MTTRHQIALVSIIALMAGLGYAATRILLVTVDRLTIANRKIVLLEKGEILQKESTGKTSLAIQRTLKEVQGAPELVVGFEYAQYEDESRTMVLTSKEIGYGDTVFSLWHDEQSQNRGNVSNLQLLKTFQAKSASLKQEQRDGRDLFALHIIQSDSNEYHEFTYVVYDSNGFLEFSYENEGKAEVKITNNQSDSFIIKPTFTSTCSHSATEEGVKIQGNGLMVDGRKNPLPAKDALCIVEATISGAELTEPTLDFIEHDPVFSILTVKLPDGRPVMIDVLTRQIVNSKQVYNNLCWGNERGLESLALTTPSGTQVILEDVASDKTLSDAGASDNFSSKCLNWIRNTKDRNPKFEYLGNWMEGGVYLGTFELDLKTKKFKKL